MRLADIIPAQMFLRKLTKKQQKIISQVAFGVILLLFTGYSARFIERTSFEVDGVRYFALFDDAMISMQYARNLAEGNGLVWNAGGERVEGFSNPLWVFYMALFHLLGLPERIVSITIQMSGAIFLLINIVLVKKIADQVLGGYLAPLLVTFLVTFYFHLNNWALQGMEVGLLVALLSASVLLALRDIDSKRFSIWPYILLSVGTFVRFDMVVPMTVLTAFMAWKSPKHQTQHLVSGFGLLISATVVQTIGRYAYYGDLLPNTYYLKVAGVPLLDRLRRGISVFGDFVWGSGWLLLVLPLLLMLLKPDTSSMLLFGILLGQIAYSIYIGGDAWEHKGGANRFIAIAMPMFFILFVQILERIRIALLGQSRTFTRTIASQALMGGLVITSLFSFNVINENDPLAKWTLMKRPIFVQGTERYVTLGLLINEITDDKARVAVVTAGNIIYFADRVGIDMLGKSDRVIAHSRPHENSGVLDNVEEIFRPGHNKWNYDYSISQLRPDIVAQIWGSTREAAPYLEKGGYEYYEVDGFPLYIRTDSHHINWNLVNSKASNLEQN
jgi:hypothetical protein